VAAAGSRLDVLAAEVKVATILGTRPEIIRLSKIIKKLDSVLGRDNHHVFHTGQNYDRNLDAAFFEELELREPDCRVEAGGGTLAEQLAICLPKLERWLLHFQPDRFLVLGDTNSSVGALIAARLGIPVYHLEAGNRCHGAESPEEVNRKVIDHISTVHLCYSERARMNLIAEGLPLARTYVVGNPLAEMVSLNNPKETGYARHFMLYKKYNVDRDKYILSTLHRAENVDNPERLQAFLDAIQSVALALDMKAVMSLHPRTKGKLGDQTYDNIIFCAPMPFREFLTLEMGAGLVISDSGTAPEECAMMHKPLIILRDYMERQEVLERGCCALWTDRSQCTLLKVATTLLSQSRDDYHFQAPEEYCRPVASTVAQILLSPVPPY
jgi:UDP-N-acetylglucosamine 2-epimerase (non-hydrolysing)